MGNRRQIFDTEITEKRIPFPDNAVSFGAILFDSAVSQAVNVFIFQTFD
jgi:hypothetical protein